MTTVLQFTSTSPVGIATAKGAMLLLANTGSMLTYRAENDTDQVTKPFDGSQWHTHTTVPDLYWCDWSAIYAQLGEIGQQQADMLVGTVDRPGLLTAATLPGPSMIKLDLKTVGDLVAAGYLPTPIVTPFTPGGAG